MWTNEHMIIGVLHNNYPSVKGWTGSLDLNIYNHTMATSSGETNYETFMSCLCDINSWTKMKIHRELLQNAYLKMTVKYCCKSEAFTLDLQQSQRVNFFWYMYKMFMCIYSLRQTERENLAVIQFNFGLKDIPRVFWKWVNNRELLQYSIHL